MLTCSSCGCSPVSYSPQQQLLHLRDVTSVSLYCVQLLFLHWGLQIRWPDHHFHGCPPPMSRDKISFDSSSSLASSSDAQPPSLQEQIEVVVQVALAKALAPPPSLPVASFAIPATTILGMLSCKLMALSYRGGSPRATPSHKDERPPSCRI